MPLAPKVAGGARGGWCGLRSPAHTWAAGRGSSAPPGSRVWGPAPPVRPGCLERIPPPALSGSGPRRLPCARGVAAAKQPRGASLALPLRPAGCSEPRGPEPGWSRRARIAPHTAEAFADRAPGRRDLARPRAHLPRGRGCGQKPGPAAPQPQVWELPALL